MKKNKISILSIINMVKFTFSMLKSRVTLLIEKFRKTEIQRRGPD
jgi:hypothetical protein